MALDGITLSLIKDDLLKTAGGCRVEKITHPTPDRVLIFLNKSGFRGCLLLCAGQSPRVHFTTEKYENPAAPPMFCMLLRKKLSGGRLCDVRTAGVDRIVFLDFSCRDELGDERVLTLAVEVMGRNSNIVLIDSGKITDCLYRLDPVEGKRFMLPGAQYELPPANTRINPRESSADDIMAELAKSPALPLWKALGETIDGLSPLIYRELALPICGEDERTFGEISQEQKDNLKTRIKELQANVENGGTPTLIKSAAGETIDFSFMPIHQYGGGYENVCYENFHLLLDDFYTKRDSEQRIKQMAQSLSRAVNNAISRTKRKIEARQKDLKKTADIEYLRKYGELVKANLHSITPGDTSLECVDYYSENQEIIKIPLKPELSPAKNAARYFQQYRKLSTAAGMLNELIDKARQDLVYYESVVLSIERAEKASDLAAIKEELMLTGLVRTGSAQNKQNKKKQRSATPTPDKYISPDSFVVFVGKNNTQNDWLTTKFADKRDLWLHTKDIPGSHVIVVSEGKQIPESTIEYAAILAAKNSKASGSRQVPVDYTLVKHVKKPSGAKPGMVTYTHQKTAFVDAVTMQEKE